jgi:hypothetical protein
MIIRMYPMAARWGNKLLAQGIALGWVLFGLSGRLSDACG